MVKYLNKMCHAAMASVPRSSSVPMSGFGKIDFIASDANVRRA